MTAYEYNRKQELTTLHGCLTWGLEWLCQNNVVKPYWTRYVKVTWEFQEQKPLLDSTFGGLKWTLI